MKLSPLLALPPTVTTTFPVVAPPGTVVMMYPVVHHVGVVCTPLKVIVLEPCVAPKLLPLISTCVPASPELGDKVASAGGTGGVVVTVNREGLLAIPPTLTTTLPVVAPVGTSTDMELELQLVGVATTPLKVTRLLPCTPPKFAPPIVTGLPTVPELGDKLVIEGADPTENSTPFEITPPTVTTTAPVVAPAGTGTLIDALPHVVGIAVVPLNVTELPPWLVPKFSPVTVTEVPTGPMFGDKVVMVGAELTVYVAVLLARPPTVTTTGPV